MAVAALSTAVRGAHTPAPVQAAFAEWKSAWAAYNATPVEDETPESEEAFWTRLGQLEATIRDTPTREAADVAAKLWLVLAHTALGHTGREGVATTASVEGLQRIHDELDSNQQLIASAIVALTAMEG